MEPPSDLDIRPLSFDDVKKATKNFSTVLGEGGFGKVYKGVLRETGKEPQEVAVKVLGPQSFQGVEEFLVSRRGMSRAIRECESNGKRKPVPVYTPHGLSLVCVPDSGSLPQLSAAEARSLEEYDHIIS